MSMFPWLSWLLAILAGELNKEAKQNLEPTKGITTYSLNTQILAETFTEAVVREDIVQDYDCIQEHGSTKELVGTFRCIQRKTCRFFLTERFLQIRLEAHGQCRVGQSRESEACWMQGRRKGGMVVWEDVLGKGRHGTCKVVPFREKGDTVNAG